MKTYAFRLHRGEDLLRSIKAFAVENGVQAAYVGACVGCVLSAVIRDASGVTLRRIDKPMEIVSLTGTVSEHRCHLHISFSREDLSTIGGHLMEGCLVNTTAEIVLCEVKGLRFGSAFDEQTGYDELEIRPKH